MQIRLQRQLLYPSILEAAEKLQMNAFGMSLLIIFALLNSLSVRTTVAVVIEPKNTTVFRYQNRPVSYGHFELYFYSILEAQKLASFFVCFVEKQSECPFECVNDLKCYSCNIAVYPVSKGHLCELLTTDKYRAKAKFHANASFHHYSLLVSSVT